MNTNPFNIVLGKFPDEHIEKLKNVEGWVADKDINNLPVTRPRITRLANHTTPQGYSWVCCEQTSYNTVKGILRSLRIEELKKSPFSLMDVSVDDRIVRITDNYENWIMVDRIFDTYLDCCDVKKGIWGFELPKTDEKIWIKYED